MTQTTWDIHSRPEKTVNWSVPSLFFWKKQWEETCRLVLPLSHFLAANMELLCFGILGATYLTTREIVNEKLPFIFVSTQRRLISLHWLWNIFQSCKDSAVNIRSEAWDTPMKCKKLNGPSKTMLCMQLFVVESCRLWKKLKILTQWLLVI